MKKIVLRSQEEHAARALVSDLEKHRIEAAIDAAAAAEKAAAAPSKVAELAARSSREKLAALDAELAEARALLEQRFPGEKTDC